MGLLDQAIQDAKRFSSDKDGFAQDITFISPSNQTVTTQGLHKKIWLGVDTEGNRISSKQSYVSVSELIFNDASYPIRNNNGEVSFENHKVNVMDVTGTLCYYIAKYWMPDEQTGLIEICLEDYYD